MPNTIIFGDNLPHLSKIPDESIDLIYIDPPFNTGKSQKLKTIKTIQDPQGDRRGFQGKTYKTIEVGTLEYQDTFNFDALGFVDESKTQAYKRIAPEGSIYFLEVFLRPRLEEAKRLLKPTGSLYFHIDYRESHYCKILLDNIFGRENFINEIIWAYDFGGRPRTKWPAKHDNILFYVKDASRYVFNTSELDREQYMAPGLVGEEKAKRGKLPTDTWFPTENIGKKYPDVWWQTIVPTNSKERWGYPTQKPRQLLDRIIQASTFKGGVVLDFFAGSGTTGRSAYQNGRQFVLIDNNLSAMEIMAVRFSDVDNISWKNFDPKPFQTNSKKNQPARQLLDLSATPSMDLEFRNLAAAAVPLQGDLEEVNDLWKGSPFEWVLQLQSRKKGKFARELLISWLFSEGVASEKVRLASEALKIGKLIFAIKFSTLWTTGTYMFQQIRSTGYDHLICFGLSPFSAHCWVIDKQTALQNSTVQHRAEKGAEYWLEIDPKTPPIWIKHFGGSLAQALNKIKKTIKEEKNGKKN